MQEMLTPTKNEEFNVFSNPEQIQLTSLNDVVDVMSFLLGRLSILGIIKSVDEFAYEFANIRESHSDVRGTVIRNTYNIITSEELK